MACKSGINTIKSINTMHYVYETEELYRPHNSSALDIPSLTLQGGQSLRPQTIVSNITIVLQESSEVGVLFPVFSLG